MSISLTFPSTWPTDCPPPDAVHQRLLPPKLGRWIAKGTLRPEHGKTKLTTGKQPTHTTWWAYDGVDRAARLRQSILKQAFEGKLVPQDPTDEPASVLLERMRAKQASHQGNGKADRRARTRGRRARSRMTEGRADK